MASSLAHLRLLVIQIRESDHIALHERQCLSETCRIGLEQIDSANLVQTPSLDWARIEAADVVIIGGAGAYSATQDYDFMPLLSAHIKRMIDVEKPLFGSCWGHQYIARVLGGRVVTDEERSEVGQFEIEQTRQGRADLVFSQLPEAFLVLLGHHDRVSHLPRTAVELAYSPLCRNQAFRIDGKPVYCTQFHAEMSPARLIERLEIYRDSYLPSEQEFETLRRQILPTPEAESILPRFIEAFA